MTKEKKPRTVDEILKSKDKKEVKQKQEHLTTMSLDEVGELYSKMNKANYSEIRSLKDNQQVLIKALVYTGAFALGFGYLYFKKQSRINERENYE